MNVNGNYAPAAMAGNTYSPANGGGAAEAGSSVGAGGLSPGGVLAALVAILNKKNAQANSKMQSVTNQPEGKDNQGNTGMLQAQQAVNEVNTDTGIATNIMKSLSDTNGQVVSNMK